jgi:hypothetical protein
MIRRRSCRRSPHPAARTGRHRARSPARASSSADYADSAGGKLVQAAPSGQIAVRRLVAEGGSQASKRFFEFFIVATFAQLGRDIIHENARAGLVAARARGKTGGRKPVTDEDKKAPEFDRQQVIGYYCPSTRPYAAQ